MDMKNGVTVQNYIMQDKMPRNEQGQRHGRWEIYRSTGQLWHISTYVNGDLYGMFFMFHPSGRIAFESFMIHTERYGYSVEYNSRGLKTKEYHAR